MYDAFDEPYCYPNSAVLRNRLDLRDARTLEAFEAEMVTERAAEPLPAGRLGVSHLCAIHRHLFQDVYAWAGRFRTVRLARDDSMFCYPENIRPQLRELFSRLKDRDWLRGLDADAFAPQAAHCLSELNVIHPFREGNGRTQMTFLSLLALRAGHPLDFDPLTREAFLPAIVEAFRGNETRLACQIRALIA